MPRARSLAMNPQPKYTRIAMLLHWLVALLISANLVLVWVVDHLPDEQVRPAIDTHKSLGITLLGLAILRMLWRYTHRPPALPPGYARWERRASHATHALLYLLMFLMPLSGWMHDSAWKDAATHPMQLFGLFEWPRIGWIMTLEPTTKEMWHSTLGAVHTWGGYLLYVLFTLHVAGALKHQLIDKEAELQRMLP